MNLLPPYQPLRRGEGRRVSGFRGLHQRKQNEKARTYGATNALIYRMVLVLIVVYASSLYIVACACITHRLVVDVHVATGFGNLAKVSWCADSKHHNTYAETEREEFEQFLLFSPPISADRSLVRSFSRLLFMRLPSSFIAV